MFASYRFSTVSTSFSVSRNVVFLKVSFFPCAQTTCNPRQISVNRESTLISSFSRNWWAVEPSQFLIIHPHAFFFKSNSSTRVIMFSSKTVYYIVHAHELQSLRIWWERFTSPWVCKLFRKTTFRNTGKCILRKNMTHPGIPCNTNQLLLSELQTVLFVTQSVDFHKIVNFKIVI